MGQSGGKAKVKQDKERIGKERKENLGSVENFLRGFIKRAMGLVSDKEDHITTKELEGDHVTNLDIKERN